MDGLSAAGTFMKIVKPIAALGGIAAALGLIVPAAAGAAPFRNTLTHKPAACASGSSVQVQIDGIRAGGGTLRVQAYRATDADWLEKGRWINRIELPARAGTMRVCMPLPGPGHYGIAVRHDVNGNGKTDLSTDGGAMSNNPSLNIWNLGKPSYRKVGFDVGAAPRSIAITMRYR